MAIVPIEQQRGPAGGGLVAIRARSFLSSDDGA
jgi:hypothetical protein